MKLEEIIEAQNKAIEDVKKAFLSKVGEIVDSTEFNTLLRLKKDFEDRSKKIKEKPEHQIQAFYREQSGGKEYLTFHMNTKVEDEESKAEFFNHYGKYNMPVFKSNRQDISGVPIYDVEDTETRYFIEFSKKNYDELKTYADGAGLYIKSKKGMAYGPFIESDWLGRKLDELEFAGKTGNVRVMDGNKAD